MSGLISTPDEASSSQSKPVQIISIENGKFKLKNDELKHILTHPIAQDKPIFIVSIVGAFRTGKSFLLTKFLHYLEETSSHTSSKNASHTNENDTRGGFGWSYGSNSHTKGIWMWNTPFVVNVNKNHPTENSKEICVLLMDTQGTFDNFSSQKDCASIFSISAFLSSIQVYNLKSNLERTDLEYLNVFSQYKKITEKIFNKPFQFEQLTFLIRDWQFPDEFAYGKDGGEQFLRTRLQDLTQAKHDESDQNTISSEMSEITANLKSYFKKRVCFLLPSPGPVVTRKDFNGDLRELDTNFVEHCKLFFRMTTDDIEAIFQDKHLLNRGFKSGQQLYDLFKDYIQVFDSDHLPNLESIAKVYQKHHNMICKLSKVQLYKETMQKFLDANRPFVEEKRLNETDRSTRDECISEYTFNYMGCENVSADDRSDFEQELNDAFVHFAAINKKCKEALTSELTERALTYYEKEMNDHVNAIIIFLKFCNEKKRYVKSIDLFLKHQQVKTSCMDELTRLRASRPGELDQAYETLNEQLDNMLKSIDAENIRKRELLVKNVKANAIGKYKTYMKNCYINKSYLEADEFHASHLIAVEKCLEEFESQTKIDPDLNEDYKALLNELRAVYSTLLLENQNKIKANKPSSKLASFLANPSKFLQDMKHSGKKGRTNSPTSSSSSSAGGNEPSEGELNTDLSQLGLRMLKQPGELIQSTIYLISFSMLLLISYGMALAEFVSDLNIPYLYLVGYGLSFLKTSSLFILDMIVDLLTFLRTNAMSSKNESPNRNTERSYEDPIKTKLS